MIRATFLFVFFSATILLSIARGGVISSSIQVGDNDGYGFGVPDNGNVVAWPGSGVSGTDFDGRSASEAGATDGAQFTDVFAALRPDVGPNTSRIGNVVFPLLPTETILSAVFTVDMGDFEATSFGEFGVWFNGVGQPGLFDVDDGFRATAVRSFVLDSSAIERANLASEFVVTIHSFSSGDFVAFDYFRLDYEVQIDGHMPSVPEPRSLAICSFGAIGLIVLRGKRRRHVV